MTEYVEKLTALRAALRHYSLDAYVITIADPHLGENITDHWQIIKWLTGFTGSAATVVISDSSAGLWTDSRYFIQAEKELEGSGYILIKPGQKTQNSYSDWLSENIQPGSRIGLDGRLFSIRAVRSLEESLSQKNISITLNRDLISPLWTDRPKLPLSRVFDHQVRYSGRERALKIGDVRSGMKEAGVTHHLLTSPDDIMWLLNIRGGDYKHSPLTLSWAVVGPDQVLLFADEGKFPPELLREFDRLGIVILPYEEINSVIHKIPKNAVLLISPERTSAELFHSVNGSVRIRENISIPARLKAIKNKTEIACLSGCMKKDGAALTRFFFWIEQNLGTIPMSEVSLSRKLNDFRSQQEGFLGNSFDPIIAWNGHAALPHYRPGNGNDAIIGDNGILLVDSGGQYLDGTTDITRTIAVGLPSLASKRDFTLVLKGHIGLACAKFPSGTKGYQIDILARKPLWENGLNFGHGTGHGVGFCLNVHEGPQNISPADNKTAIEAGMLISNEPGIYREGEYGIRTENLVVCREDEETGFGNFLRFETISLCYIDKRLIDRSLLDTEEIKWINSYHSEVFEKLKPLLSIPEQEWLREKTTEL